MTMTLPDLHLLLILVTIGLMLAAAANATSDPHQAFASLGLLVVVLLLGPLFWSNR